MTAEAEDSEEIAEDSEEIAEGADSVVETDLEIEEILLTGEIEGLL